MHTRLLATGACVVSAVVLLAGHAGADPLPVNRSGWVVNDYVTDTVTSGNTLYLSGAFTALAPTQNHVGRFVELHLGSAQPARLPAEVTGGLVHAIIDDGGGGWFVGGAFTGIGGAPQRHLAHVRADGSFDAGFAPVVNSPVYALLRSGTTLYLAGAFSNVNGQARGSGAAFDTTTGALLAWNPQVSGTVRDIYALAAVGDAIAVGGLFSTVSGAFRGNLAMVHRTTGSLLAATANIPTGSVRALAARGNTLYVGGSFGSIGTALRSNLAAIDATTGAVLPMVANTNGLVGALLATDSGLYVGGEMTTIGGSGRRYLALVDPTSGSVAAWHPDANGAVYALALSGNTLVVGGWFTMVGGQGRAHVAAVEATGAGTLLPWNAGLSSHTYALAASQAGTVAAGGAFTHYGATARQRVAAIDLVTGALQPLALRPSSVVMDLEVGGPTLYLAGSFATVNGVQRLGFAAVDIHSGALLPWNPQANSPTGRSVAVVGPTVFLGGFFSSLGGQPRTALGQVDATTGAVTPFVMNASGVTALALPGVLDLKRHGTRLFVAGNFTSLGGQARSALAALDLNSLALTGPAVSIGGPVVRVDALEPIGDTLYFAGTFGSAGGQTRGHVAAVAISTGAVLPFAPVANQPVFDLAATFDTVYLAGNFTTVNGQARRMVAAVDAATGATVRPFSIDGGAGTVVGEAGGHVSVGPEGLWVGANALTPGPSYLLFFPDAAMGGVPGPPSTPTVQLTGGLLTLQWAPPTLGGVPVDYLVEAGTGPGLADIATLPLGSTTPRFTYAGVPGGVYYIRTRARSAAGVGPPSGEVALAAGVPGCAGPPQSTLATTAMNGGVVTLSWDDPVSGAGAPSHTLEAGSAPLQADIASVPVGTARVFSATAPPGVYFARLRTTSACGIAPVSPELTIEAGGSRRVTPPVLTAQVNGGRVSIFWDAVPGATSYVLQAGSGPTLTDVAAIQLVGTALDATAPSGTYYVRVMAIGPTGRSAPSKELVLVVP